MTLTELSYYSRKMLPFGILTVLMLLILFYMVKILFLYIGGGPAKPAQYKFTYKFGKNIKAPVFTNASSSANLNYSLDTVSGTVETATSAAQVFLLPKSATKFGYRDKIYLMAEAFGFDKSVLHTTNGTEATFQDENQSVTIDIRNFNFSYRYEMQKDPELFKNIQIPQDSYEIENKAIEFLKRIDRYPEELAQAKPVISYLTFDPANPSALVISDVPDSTTNMVEVNFYRQDVASSPKAISVVSPTYFSSQNHVIMVFNDQNVKIVKAQVHFFEKTQTPTQVDIYPIKTGADAYKDLQEGNGFIVSSPPGLTSVVIKKTFLAYYDPEVHQDYFQPVYVFLADNNFVAYVPAVVGSVVSNEPSE